MMMNILHWAFSDIKRNKGFLILFMLSFACCIFMITIIFDQTTAAYQELQALQNLQQSHIQALQISYLPKGTSYAAAMPKSYFKHAYSVIEKPLGFDDDNTLYIIGNQELVQKLLQLDTPLHDMDAFVFSDQDRKTLQATIEKQKLSIKHISLLPKELYIASKTNASLPLHEYVVIYRDFSSIDILEFSQDELLGNMLFVNESPSNLQRLVAYINSNQNYIEIQSYDYLNNRKHRVDDLVVGSIIYMTMFLSSFLIVLLMMAVNNMILVEKKLGEYTIHIVLGARLHQIYARIFCYNVLVIGCSTLLFALLQTWTGLLQRSHPGFVMMIALFSIVLLTLLPMIKIKKDNLFETMRGNFI